MGCRPTLAALKCTLIVFSDKLFDCCLIIATIVADVVQAVWPAFLEHDGL